MNAIMVEMDIRSGIRTHADGATRAAAASSCLRCGAFATTTTKLGKTTL
ncbi:hypothetical protein [Thalassobaculum sp.]